MLRIGNSILSARLGELRRSVSFISIANTTISSIAAELYDPCVSRNRSLEFDRDSQTPKLTKMACRAMRWYFEYPLRAISDAVESALLWGLVISASVFAGSWIGVSLTLQQFAPIAEIVLFLAMCATAAIAHPLAALAIGLTLLAWYLPSHFPSIWFAIAAFVVTITVWAALPWAFWKV